MSRPVKTRPLFEEPFEEHPGVEYQPCQNCFSLDYDIADGEVDEKGIYCPRTCDVCNFGNIKGSNIPIH